MPCPGIASAPSTATDSRRRGFGAASPCITIDVHNHRRTRREGQHDDKADAGALAIACRLDLAKGFGPVHPGPRNVLQIPRGVFLTDCVGDRE